MYCSEGEFNKDYDRLETSDSMLRFVLDPKGDKPWEEEATAKDVVHIADADVRFYFSIIRYLLQNFQRMFRFSY